MRSSPPWGCASWNIHYYLVVTFSITYLSTQAHIESGEILGLLLGAHAIHAVLVPLVGAATDRFGRKMPYGVGIVLTATWGFFAFPMYDTGNAVMIFVALLLGLVFHASMYAGQPAIMAEMFPTRMRNSGVSTGYQATAIVAGSFAPFIATALLKGFGSSVPIALYLLAAAIVSFIALLYTRETKGIDLRSLDTADKVRRGVA